MRDYSAYRFELVIVLLVSWLNFVRNKFHLFTMDLLVVGDGIRQIYILIKDFDRFVHKHIQHNGRAHISKSTVFVILPQGEEDNDRVFGEKNRRAYTPSWCKHWMSVCCS